MNEILILFGLLSIKHFIVDFVLQTDRQVQTKGILFHPVGFSHSLEHGIWTAAILSFYTPLGYAILIGYLETPIHYTIDFLKMRFGCRDTTKKLFWVQLGLDQLAHYLTYIMIIKFFMEVLAISPKL